VAISLIGWGDRPVGLFGVQVDTTQIRRKTIVYPDSAEIRKNFLPSAVEAILLAG
jgi:hypothetical protein